MPTAKLFRNGNCQAVRIPKEFAFEGELVTLEKQGDALVIRPVKHCWSAVWDCLDAFSPDFVEQAVRPGQLPAQEREEL